MSKKILDRYLPVEQVLFYIVPVPTKYCSIIYKTTTILSNERLFNKNLNTIFLLSIFLLNNFDVY